jgi:hypothetical protein
MNERIKELAEQAGCKVMDDGEWYIPSAAGLEKIVYTQGTGLEKFAELIVRECMKESMAEIVDDEDIAEQTHPLIREYLLGCNQGIVDAVVRFRNHFGVKE